MLPYSLLFLWNDPGRFGTAVIGVAFSGVLILLQGGLLHGNLALATRPIDLAAADLWVAAPNTESLGYGEPMPEGWEARVWNCPGVERTEPLLFGFALWVKPDGTRDHCYVIGTRLDGDSLGAPADMTPQLRAQLTEPGTVGVYEADLGLLGLTGPGAGDVGDRRVVVTGVMRGARGAGLMPGLFCSLTTARQLLPAVRPDTGRVSYFLARCRDRAPATAAHWMRERYPDMEALTKAEFSRRTRQHWVVKTKAGVALAFVAALGLLVGGSITAQALHAMTTAGRREFAALQALGIPRGRVRRLVLGQVFWTALAGNLAAVPLAIGLAAVGGAEGVAVVIPGWLFAAAPLLTGATALGAGLFALRSLRLTDPMVLLLTAAQ